MKQRENVLWLYGTLVALAIREVLLRVPPYINDHWFITSTTPAHREGDDPALFVWRSFIFLIVIARFYLGAAVFVARVHLLPQASVAPGQGVKQQSLMADFIIGLVHFLGFFVWSLTVTSVTWIQMLSPFTLVLVGILLVDTLYVPVQAGLADLHTLRERARMRLWARRNRYSAWWVLGVLIVLGLVLEWQRLAEVAALATLIRVSFKDVQELLLKPRRLPQVRWWDP